MEAITFEKLPQAVSQLYDKLESIERLLIENNSQSHPEADQLLTIQQTAEIISLSIPTIYGLVSRAEIPVCKKGKRLYFSKMEIQDWIKSGRKKTVAEIANESDSYIKNGKRKRG